LGPRDGRDLARILLERARGDALVVERLTDDPEIPDHVVGFHAQQAVEKLLKAVLSHHGVNYGRTHDLSRLVELVEMKNLALPPDAHRLATLTPWATGLRYGDDPVDPGPLDREGALGLIATVRDWASRVLN
jgi:HEPN domain-containing protein